jgi:hypothetical protein
VTNKTANVKCVSSCCQITHPVAAFLTVVASTGAEAGALEAGAGGLGLLLWGLRLQKLNRLD